MVTITRRQAVAGLGLLPALGATRVQAQTQVLRVAAITPPNHPTTEGLVAMGNELKEATKGRLTLTVFPSGQLGTEAQVVQQLQTGAVDMAWLTTTEVVNHVQDFAALHAPLLVRSIEGAGKILRSKPAYDLLEKLPPVGFVGLAYGMSGLRHIYARQTVSSLADLKGKKIRIIPSPSFRDFYSLLGMAPTPINYADVYNALANGQIDGIDMDFDGAVSNRFYDHLKTLLVSNHCLLGTVASVSGRTWARLSPEDQEIMRQLNRKYSDILIEKVAAQMGDNFAKLKATHLQIREVDTSFFGDVVAEWDKIWLPKAPVLKDLRAAAAQLQG